ncbi:hypothetical protein [Streptomyces sp. NBC_00091]|uniref:hypothetical protein n=1 Tax=Streptomyces sp. NBC_00091 TaxID=2975648 RepID=UPI00225629F2|nr:hypothetical protein [Streptomyces sp. NBC_00091]MCX5381460.1 hypothetical protein [Streptomyces sp. NBC_00091]
MTATINGGRQADTERRRTRVKSAITAARSNGTSLTAAGIARLAARVHQLEERLSKALGEEVW